jgi:hypothetical protein
MSWVKRNLFFLIGSVIALALLGLAGFYLYSKWDLNNKVLDQLNQAYEDLKGLNAQNPHPGSGAVNNIDTAKEQIKQVKVALDKTREYFQKIPPIPDLPKMTDHVFSTALDRTVAQFSRDATNSSVTIPANYSFSFSAERSKMGFSAGSLKPLSVQLGEVKAICDILFAAKVNSFDYIRRERASADDAVGPQGDYLAEKSITNSLAVLSPYEISFHCFSPELASVLSGFAKSPYGLLVQFINIEVSAPTTPEVTAAAPPAPIYVPPPVAPNVAQDQAFRSRYGIGEGESMRSRYGPSKFPGPAPAPTQPQPVYPVATAPAKTGLPTVIDEKQLKVTIVLNIVKLIAPASSAGPAPARPPR